MAAAFRVATDNAAARKLKREVATA
jgi:hypothetical protein